MRLFQLITGNRLEALMDILAEVVSHPLRSVQAPEVIMVQSRGMARWIALELARRHGICANIRFPFPNAFIHEDVFGAIMPEAGRDPALSTDFMVWRILKAIPRVAPDPRYRELARYLRDEPVQLKSIQMAVRLATTFDQYQLYRPEWLFEWEGGKTADNWQSLLWREIVGDRPNQHPAALARAAFQRLDEKPELARRLPDRISVFGISFLPRFHLEVLSRLASHRPVRLFVLNPCEDYWGDVLSPRETRRIIRKAGGDAAGPALSSQNALLAACGRQGRDFFDMAYDLDAEVEPVFMETGSDTLLGRLQADVRYQREGDRPADGPDPAPIAVADQSVCIRSCHSPMREVETLHDHLLGLLEGLAGLRPRDVLIMIPDILTYAPYIQAVFERPRDDPGFIPFSIADRGPGHAGRLMEAFGSIMDCVGSKFEVTRILAILENPVVMSRMGFTDSDTALIRGWIQNAGIRWGRDAADRRSRGLPDFGEHTWREGLDRLLLGYAIGLDETRTFQALLPATLGDSGHDTLDRILFFASRLFDWIERLDQPRPPTGWRTVLMDLMAEFLPADEDTQGEYHAIRQVIADMAVSAHAAGFDAPLHLDAIREFLKDRLDLDRRGSGFISHGVTFCAMLPMRSIPFRVIGLLGMDVNAFPRQDARWGFDLMKARPRPGDPSRREDDRYLFLEAVLSARDQVYISFVGQSIQDNAAIPPSVLVSEWMDVIERSYVMANGRPIRDHIFRRHRLQPFDPAYFTDGDPKGIGQSFSEAHCRSAKVLMDQKKPATPFVEAALSDPDPAWRRVSLTDVSAFFRNPCAFLLNRRLMLRLKDADDAIPDHEPFDIEGLDRYAWMARLVKEAWRGRELTTWFDVARGAGHLPHGAVGIYRFQEICAAASSCAARAAVWMENPVLEEIPVTLALDGFDVTGLLTDMHQDHHLRFRPGSIRPVDRLEAWLNHLVLNCVRAAAEPDRTVLVGADAAYQFKPVLDAADCLTALLRIYWEGLSRPLPFFPTISFAYCDRLIGREANETESLFHAVSKWESDHGYPERLDPHVVRCFGHGDPLDADFQKLAVAVFGPLLAHMGKLS